MIITSLWALDSSAMPEHAARPGRPRSPQADEAILAAARDLLAGGGLSNLTVEGTALRAGVAKTTVYRRYPTKLDLAVAAVSGLLAQSPPGSTIEDTTSAGISDFERSLGAAGAQAAYLAVAAAAATDPSMHRQFTASVIEPVRRHLADILEGAVARGEARPDADLGFIHDVLIGTLLHHLVICQQPVDEAFTSHFTELVRFVYNDAR